MKYFKKREHKSKTENEAGISLVEVVVASALVVVLVIGTYRGYLGVMDILQLSRYKVAATDLATEKIELIRNIPFQNIGIQDGLPPGVIPKEEEVVRGSTSFVVTSTVRDIDDNFDGTIGGDPNDTSPADYKKVEVEVVCVNCDYDPVILTTTVAPKGLETIAGNGALFVEAFDANGEPIVEADVHIENNSLDPIVIVDETTNNQGMLQIVNAPPASDTYEITVSKDGYTTSKTYEPGAPGNPNPEEPHATVVEGSVAERSFSIDKVSTANIASFTKTCSPVGNIDFNLQGSKKIGQEPVVYKYNQDHQTNGSGFLTINDFEWDTYTISSLDSAYDISGITPTSPFIVNPDSEIDVSLTVSPVNSNSLLVSVLDSETGLPLSGATTTLESSGGGEDVFLTGRGFLSQTDWSGGSGQELYEDETRFDTADSSIDIDNPEGELKLTEVFGSYSEDGVLTSSIFDTGSDSNFHHITWEPGDQPISAGPLSVRFQIATSNSTTTEDWLFAGPDGTSGTYYVTPNTAIADLHDGDRYFRYKLFLHTDDTDFTPNVSEVSFTFASDCVPAGQVIFQGKSMDDYTLKVEKDGYLNTDEIVEIGSSWQQKVITLSPE